MVIQSLKGNVGERITSARNLLNKEIDAGKALVLDVVERFDLDENVTPSSSVDGIGGTLPGSVIVFGIKTYRNLTDFIKDQAQITRKLVTRR